MSYDKEHPAVLIYALIFFLLLGVTAYLLLKQNLESANNQARSQATELISPAAIDLNQLFQ